MFDLGYEATIKKYLKALHKEYRAAQSGRQHTAELSYRVPMHTLFQDLSHDLNPEAEIVIVQEPKSQGKVGRPDWRIHDKNSLGIYGYVEAKGLTEEKFDIAPYLTQIKKYLTLKHKLIITDGIDFVFCKENKEPTIVSIIDKAGLKLADWSRASVDPQFEIYMRDFFDNPSPQHCDEGKLVELVAVRTRMLADDIMAYSDLSIDEAIDDSERQAIELLTGIRNLIYSHNDEKLRNNMVFADFVAQVIMFCLLYAHRVLCKSEDLPSEKEKKIREYISKELVEGEALLPFRKLMLYLKDTAETGAFITQWVDECIKFLSFVKMTDQQLLNPDYHRLFELFLSKYDARARFDYGAFYTPKALADFVVKLTNYIVDETYEGMSIYDDGNTIIDPCCGTGSFLEQVIQHDTKRGDYNLCGFEILPAPYMLANYRMALIKKQTGYASLKCNIIMANTLSNCVLGEDADESSIEGNELRRAKELASMPLRLIIGNPPCSDSKHTEVTSDFSIINDMMEDFRPPLEERRSRQNIQKQITNPFMLFLRWSCEKLLSNENHSVLSLVVPLSFLEAESYKYARKYLVENFSGIWAIEIDADARTGVRSDSLFRTLQGRAVVILTRKYGEQSGVCEYHYADFSHQNRAEKEAILGAPIVEIFEKFSTHKIVDGTYAFMPSKAFDEQMYGSFWPVSDDNGRKAIFLRQCSGAKLAPTALLTHVKLPMLKRRSREIASGGITTAREWIDKQDKKVVDEKILAFQSALNTCNSRAELDNVLSESIQPISFRPYVNSNVLLWDEVFKHLAGVAGGGTRIRPEIEMVYREESTIGFALAHAPKDLDDSLGQFTSFCWYFPDNDLSKRGNGHVYLNQYPDESTGKIKNNIHSELLDKLGNICELDKDCIAKKMVFYSYAVFCSQVYLDEFYGALFTVNQSDRRARIPIVNDKDTFLKLAELGERIALLEKNSPEVENILRFDYDGLLNQLNNGFHLEHSRSQAKSPFDEEREVLYIRDENSSTVIEIYCPVSLQNFKVSGYAVIKDCWLKFHSYRYTHCDFKKEDLKELLDLLNAIAMQMRIVSEIDEIIHLIIDGKIDLIQPE